MYKTIIMKKQFKVITVSATGSFGLHNVAICDITGIAFEVITPSWCCPKQGNFVTGQVAENGQLQLLDGIIIEHARKIASPDPTTLKEMFPEKKMVNLAKGKKINNTLDFAKAFDKLDVMEKAAVIRNISETLKTGISPRGTVMMAEERGAIERLLRWCTVNIAVGNTLCPPDYLSHF